MANLDEKFLDGPSVGYCSSSEDEGGGRGGENEGNGSKCLNNSSNNSSSTGHQKLGRKAEGQPKTGPKGVLADYERQQRAQRAERKAQELELLKLADRFSLETPGNKQHPGEEEEDADELDRIRARRLEQMKSMAKGRILEVSDRFEFLQLIEQQPRHSLLFMHIYADGNEQSDRLNDALLELAGKFGGGQQRTGKGQTAAAAAAAKFYKVQTSVLGTSAKFARDALPALQVYQGEQLVGNFIRLTQELGDDYDGQDLLRFLRRDRHAIPLLDEL